MNNQQNLCFSVPRISGQADIDIYYGADPSTAQAYVRMPHLRAFHVLAVGRPAEELPRLVARISGLCPWHHHMAATLAVEDALGLPVPPAAQQIRNIVLLLAHIADKILHYYIISAPDIRPDMVPAENLHNLPLSAFPSRAALEARSCVSRMFQAISGQSWGGYSAVVGGVNYEIHASTLEKLHEEITSVRSFCLQGMEEAHDSLLGPLAKKYGHMDEVPFASMASVDSLNALCLSASQDTRLRSMQPDGSNIHFAPRDYQSHIVEEYADWTRCTFPRLRTAPPLQLNPDNPQGVFRVGPLARLHCCDHISTPLAQRELEYFRAEQGPRPQHALFYHWARLIELLHCVEKIEELLQELNVDDANLRTLYAAPPVTETRHGFAYLEAPRGSLFYRISIDENTCISACDILTPTACNNAAMNISLTYAARQLLRQGPIEAAQRHLLSTCLGAYDPCPACATHALSASPASALKSAVKV